MRNRLFHYITLVRKGWKAREAIQQPNKKKNTLDVIVKLNRN